MTYLEAKALVKERAGSKYADGTLRLLEKMVGGLWRKDKENAPIENVRVTKKVRTLCMWSNVQVRQLHRLLKSLDEVKVLSRKKGSITYTLNLEPLTELKKTVELVKDKIARTNAGRANKARAIRAEISNNRTNTLATYIAVAVASGLMPAPWVAATPSQVVTR